jgi:hypothetical protein
VRDPGAVLRFVPRLSGAILLREDLVRLAVVVHVGKDGELDVEAFVDHRLLPQSARPSRVAPPRHAFSKPRHADDIRVAVGIGVHRQIAEIVDVLALEIQLAEPVRRPRRRFVPEFARDDIETAVLVDVRDRRRLTRAAVDHPGGKRNVGRPRTRPYHGRTQHKDCRVMLHRSACPCRSSGE